jgi:hypothetical protein
LYHILLNNNIKDNRISKIREFNNVEHNNSKFDLTTHTFTNKLYFIGSYIHNIDLINDLIISFLRINKIHTNISLLLFIYDTDHSVMQSLINKTKEIYRLLNIKNQIINVIPVPIANNLQSIIAAHNTGDIYLDISDGSKIPLNKNIAHQFNKPVISIDVEHLQLSSIRNSLYASTGFYHINDKWIYDKLFNFLNNPKTIQQQDKSFHNINRLSLC